MFQYKIYYIVVKIVLIVSVESVLIILIIIYVLNVQINNTQYKEYVCIVLIIINKYLTKLVKSVNKMVVIQYVGIVRWINMKLQMDSVQNVIRYLDVLGVDQYKVYYNVLNVYQTINQLIISVYNI